MWAEIKLALARTASQLASCLVFFNTAGELSEREAEYRLEAARVALDCHLTYNEQETSLLGNC